MGSSITGMWEKTDRSQHFMVVGKAKQIKYLLKGPPRAGRSSGWLSGTRTVSRTDISVLGSLRAFLEMKVFAAE